MATHVLLLDGDPATTRVLSAVGASRGYALTSTADPEEALKLANRLIPDLLKKPAVVYFHSNQLPDPSDPKQSPFDLVNMNTASAATLQNIAIFLITSSASFCSQRTMRTSH